MPGRPGVPDDSIETLLSRCGQLVAAAAGLRFLPEQRDALIRALEQEGRDGDLRSNLEGLLSTPDDQPRLEALASQLANGETYFFRDPGMFAALRQDILPSLLRERAAAGIRRIRIWSAGCSTGEEAYSIAITLARALPDLGDWDARVLATDINAVALAYAANGVYPERAFRGKPPDPKGRFFTRDPEGRYHVSPLIRSLVTFAPLNLAAPSLPAGMPDAGAVDVIFCRNVLMYLLPERAAATVERLTLCLADGGRLLVSPVETALVAAPELEREYLSGWVAFRRQAFRPPPARPAVGSAPPPPRAAAPLPPRAAAAPDAKRAARDLADRGLLQQALARCDQGVAAHPLDPAWTYLQASVLLEMGRTGEADRALRRTLCLDPERPLAEFTLGNLLVRQGRSQMAGQHYRKALDTLEHWPADKTLPDSEGLTSERMREILLHLLKATV
ncbi:MAG: CheR family methyltransferase [Candidatus Bathyarchaeota archaeon]